MVESLHSLTLLLGFEQEVGSGWRRLVPLLHVSPLDQTRGVVLTSILYLCGLRGDVSDWGQSVGEGELLGR